MKVYHLLCSVDGKWIRLDREIEGSTQWATDARMVVTVQHVTATMHFSREWIK